MLSNKNGLREFKLIDDLKVKAVAASPHIDPKAKEAVRRLGMASLYPDSHAAFYADPFDYVYPSFVYRWDDKKLTVEGKDKVRD